MKKEFGFFIKYRNILFIIVLVILFLFLGYYFMQNIIYGIATIQKALFVSSVPPKIQSFDIEGAQALRLERFQVQAQPVLQAPVKKK